MGEPFSVDVVYTVFRSNKLIAPKNAEDKSLFKASGPVWHKKDQQAGHIPDGLRNLDTDASWSKSGYHGWVFGYGLHTTVTRDGFPLLVEVDTAKVSESEGLTRKADALLSRNIGYLVGDDNYTSFDRTKKWALRGLVLLTPASKAKSQKGRTYQQFTCQPALCDFKAARKTAIEPIFDLISRLLKTTQNHKQLPVKGQANVATFLSLGVVLTQLAML